jgi:hypothetical protein
MFGCMMYVWMDACFLVPDDDWVNPAWPFPAGNSSSSSSSSSSLGTGIVGRSEDPVPNGTWPKPLPGWAPFAAWGAVVDGACVASRRVRIPSPACGCRDPTTNVTPHLYPFVVGEGRGSKNSSSSNNNNKVKIATPTNEKKLKKQYQKCETQNSHEI